MATREQIIDVYRVILGREPEDEGAIQQWTYVPKLSTLMELFLSSEEYRSRIENRFSNGASGRRASLDWPGCVVETDRNPEILAKLFSHIMDDWTALGKSEPYYSVVSAPENLSSAFSDIAGFVESGKYDVERVRAFAERAGVVLPAEGTCLEIGCGVGRLTTWLSTLFSRVIAVDISQSHLDIARRNVAEFAGTRQVEFQHLANPAQLGGITGYDMFFSVIVLQHNPPPVMAFMLDRILQGLNPGGCAYFQLPTYRLGYSFRSEDYLNARSRVGDMEMHVLPQVEVFRIADRAGCKILEVREDDYTGHADGVSNTFFMSKAR